MKIKLVSILIIFITTFLFNHIYALSTQIDVQKSDSIINNNSVIIKFDAIRLLPDVFGMNYGCICFGIEKNFNKNSLEIDLGYITDYGETKGNGIGNISAKNVNGYYSNVEFRNYYKSTKRYKFYNGINFSYQKTKTAREELFNINYYYVNRAVYAAHINTGIRMHFSRFVFDPGIGFGIRYITSNTMDKKGTPEGDYELPYNKLYNSGDKLFPSFNYNLKIGWVF